MEVSILPNGALFEVWGGGGLIRDGFTSQQDAAFWCNEQGYTIN